MLDGSPENPLEFIQVQIANVESKFTTTIFYSASYFAVRQPGMIGSVGNILSENNVNVSFISIGRITPRRHAVMTIVPTPSLVLMGNLLGTEECSFHFSRSPRPATLTTLLSSSLESKPNPSPKLSLRRPFDLHTNGVVEEWMVFPKSVCCIKKKEKKSRSCCCLCYNQKNCVRTLYSIRKDSQKLHRLTSNIQDAVTS
ncbi:hypothetical protein NC651_033192 [Populus alba x Populus x berolinensis]|nr:hypothetical protein NC651_033192 [Populus alba x Populus x berolinensis]